MYLCCASTNYQLCKNGFTRTSDPHEYCHNQFARTYQPLNVIAVIPVVDAPTLERVSHTMLAAKKVGNEVFNMSNEDGTFNQTLWDKTVRIIKEINETSGLAFPESVEVIEERKEHQKKEAAEKRTELVQKRKAEREAEREAEAAERKRRKKEEKVAEEKQLAKERAAHWMEVETETSELLDNFIINRCKVGSSGRVAVSDFQKAFAEHTSQDPPRMFSSIMLKKGFCNKTLAIDGVKMKSYCGLVLCDSL